jgi:hypothetical protein
LNGGRWETGSSFKELGVMGGCFTIVPCTVHLALCIYFHVPCAVTCEPSGYSVVILIFHVLEPDLKKT